MAQLTSEKIFQEFTTLNNEEAYVHIFSKRMMRPVPNRLGEFFGTDQRIHFQPALLRLVKGLPIDAEIFDVGAGAGDVVDVAIKDAPPGTTVNLEEPNPILLKAYISRLKKYPHLRIGVSYAGPIQDYYQKNEKIYPAHPQNLILSIHMIYHLTDFTSPQITPEKDLIDAIAFLYSLLAVGGSIFIVYADMSDGEKGEAVCGLGEKFFRERYPKEPYADNLIRIYQARENLLGPKGVIGHELINRFPDSQCTMKSERTQSHFFADTIEDMAVLALAAELCPVDRKQFDISKLHFCLDNLKLHPEKIGLRKEDGDVPQKGMWKADEPQVLATITKVK